MDDKKILNTLKETNAEIKRLTLPQCTWEEPQEGKPFANEYSCRLENPDNFTSFRRENNAAKVDGKPIDFIYGIKSGKSKIQAIRYRKKYWSKSSARTHCNTKEHISFE